VHFAGKSGLGVPSHATRAELLHFPRGKEYSTNIPCCFCAFCPICPRVIRVRCSVSCSIRSTYLFELLSSSLFCGCWCWCISRSGGAVCCCWGCWFCAALCESEATCRTFVRCGRCSSNSETEIMSVPCAGKCYSVVACLWGAAKA